MKIVILNLILCLPFMWHSHANETPKLPTRAPALLELRDQFDAPQRLEFPGTNVVILTIADRKGSEQIDSWVTTLQTRYAGRIEWRGIADVSAVPGFLRARVRKQFQKARAYPVMMDWSGTACLQFGFKPGLANVLVLARDGNILARVVGVVGEASLKELAAAIDAALIRPASTTNAH